MDILSIKSYEGKVKLDLQRRHLHNWYERRKKGYLKSFTIVNGEGLRNMSYMNHVNVVSNGYDVDLALGKGDYCSSTPITVRPFHGNPRPESEKEGKLQNK